VNPGLIYCAITPFGERGPLAHRVGSELVLQAMTDYCHSLGSPGGPPVRWGSDIANLSTGGMACLAILAALFRRHRNGCGERVAISLFGTLMLFREASWSVLGDVDEWEGPFVLAYTNPRMHGWRTRDRDVYVRLHRAQEDDYLQLLIDLGMEEVLADERFANVGRDAVGNGRYAIEVAPIWERATSCRTSDEIVDLVLARNAMAVPFNTLSQALTHPQVQSLGILRPVDNSVLGRRCMLGAPFRGAWEPPALATAPSLGQPNGELHPWGR
jgi:crotonobetainyl-CoA:carnitine CoA-transferase CaiB-like acyl-CoA transferase